MMNIKEIKIYDDFMYDENNVGYFSECGFLKEIKVENFDNLKLNVNGKVENKENWGQIFVFEYNGKKLFTDSYSPYKNEYVIYEYSNDYCCEIFGLMSI